MRFLLNLFDSNERDIRRYRKVVEKINALEDSIARLSNEQLRAKTDEFRDRLAKGETLDDLLPEAFAVVREASKRTLKMRHFDVQLIGGMVLHDGRIAEMKTGEGKTLVATLPIYLNALEGKGVHLVTANDYLARRDAVWMGPIYHFLGMSVGVIQGQSPETGEIGGSYIYTPGYQAPDPRYMYLKECHRREAYLADITYGTNNEFGFDYLRDNMAFSIEDVVQRELNYAIVDEVDSILIDEARTPLIISGYAGESTDLYYRVDRVVRHLQPGRDYTLEEKQKIVTLTEEGIQRVEQGLGVKNLAEDPDLMHHVNAALKAHTIFKRDVDYVVRDGEIIIVDEFTGRLMFGRRYSDGLHQAIEAKEGVPIRQENQTLATITFQNYFRLYKKLAGMTGTAKTEEDEFRKIYGLDVVVVPTNKPMIRMDHPDVIYKTEEAKFRGIATEILRLYVKQQPVLVGTRSIEMSEKVSDRLRPDRLKLLCLIHILRDELEKCKEIPNEKKKEYRALLNRRLDELNLSALTPLARELGVVPDMNLPENLQRAIQLIGAPPENIEYLKEAFAHGVPHNVLNAKYHEKEAIIIAEAGRKGAVTVATNMAGRGVDIILGGSIAPQQAQEGEAVDEEAEEQWRSFRRGRALPPPPLSEAERSKAAEEVRKLGGLFILGTERHESRRIDNQLRGRSGRQGDPGESRFYVSLEDELWRRFGDPSKQRLLAMWEESEAVDVKLLSRLIEKAQKKVEAYNFEIRKHVLQYDEVMNEQRRVIYSERRRILEGHPLTATIHGFVRDKVEESVTMFTLQDTRHAEVDAEGLFRQLEELFGISRWISPEDIKSRPADKLTEYLQEVALNAYAQREEELGPELMRALERWVMLRVINDKWMEHLANMDYLREGIGLRGYAQQDPLVAYKKEAYEMFQHMLASIQEDVIRWIYHVQVAPPQPQPNVQVTSMSGAGSTPTTEEGNGAARPAARAAVATAVKTQKVGRNDPCPCGSGKKYKKCCMNKQVPS
jgi:preprotein translocase subunit SecA